MHQGDHFGYGVLEMSTRRSTTAVFRSFQRKLSGQKFPKRHQNLLSETSGQLNKTPTIYVKNL